MITENLSTLKIHKLTQAQYDRELEAGRIDENALYLTPDDANIELDTTLSVEGKAADAKAVGDALAEKQPKGNYLTSYTETDPTVPAWAKASKKPSYTASEVGADASGTAESLVNAHNSDTSAHADIREQINTLSEKMPYVIQTEAPTDTSVVWVDTSDNSNDGFQEAVNIALAQAKASGEFDGKAPEKGIDYFTDADKAEMVNAVIAALPVYSGEVV